MNRGVGQSAALREFRGKKAILFFAKTVEPHNFTA
jgi:hypothetical protein